MLDSSSHKERRTRNSTKPKDLPGVTGRRNPGKQALGEQVSNRKQRKCQNPHSNSNKTKTEQANSSNEQMVNAVLRALR